MLTSLRHILNDLQQWKALSEFDFLRWSYHRPNCKFCKEMLLIIAKKFPKFKNGNFKDTDTDINRIFTVTAMNVEYSMLAICIGHLVLVGVILWLVKAFTDNGLGFMIHEI